jgi:hypothetical protein
VGSAKEEQRRKSGAVGYEADRVCEGAVLPKSEVADRSLHWGIAIIRDAVERHDLAMRRERLGWCLKHLDEQMALLRSDVERLIGRGLDSLDDLEEAVIAADRFDRDARRATLERMVIYFGEVTRAQVGGEWTVDTNYRGLDFGEFEVSGLTAAHILANVGPETRGVTTRMLDMLVAARKTARPVEPSLMTGTWEAYCSSARAITLGDLKSRLSPEFTVTRVEGDTLFASPHDAAKLQIAVTIERGSEVTEDAEGLADLDVVLNPGVPEPDRDALRASEVRYVIAYEPDEYDELYNTLATISPALEEACGAITYDRMNERFV